MSTGADAFLLEHGFLTDGIDREKLIDAFDGEIDRALQGGKSSLQMLPSSLSASGRIRTDTPTLVVDAGGTNLRVGAVTIPSDGSAPRFEHVVRLPMPGTHGRVSADEFHGAIAAALDGVAAKVPRADRLGYCFSYGCESNADHDAKLLAWSKQVEAPEVVGQYVGAELVRRLSHPVGHIAVLNDTVATLLAGKAMYPFASDAAYLGFILGTGTNTAAVEVGEIRNAESGEFDKIVRSDFDLKLDSTTTDPGCAVFEKMISGAYLGPLGLTVLRGASDAGLFASATVSALARRDTLETRELDAFAAGETPEFAEGFDAADLAFARDVATSVFRRAAILTAVHLAAFIRRQGAKHIVLTVDGSTYYKTRSVSFDSLVRGELAGQVPDRTISVVRVDEAPMVGAAIAALSV